MTDIEIKRAHLEEKKSFLREWTQKNPLATVASVKEALTARFAETMNTGLINAALKEARDVVARRAQEESAPRIEDITVVKRSLEAMADELRAIGVTRMEFHQDGTYSVSFGTKK